SHAILAYQICDLGTINGLYRSCKWPCGLVYETYRTNARPHEPTFPPFLQSQDAPPRGRAAAFGCRGGDGVPQNALARNGRRAGLSALRRTGRLFEPAPERNDPLSLQSLLKGFHGHV